MDAKAARRMDRFTQLGVAAGMALRHAGFTIDVGNRDNVAVFFSTGAGGLAAIVDAERVRIERGPKRVSPFAVPMLMSNAPPGRSASSSAPAVWQLFASACASSNDALGLALMAIQSGRTSSAIVGATEAASPRCVSPHSTRRAPCAARATTTRRAPRARLTGTEMASSFPRWPPL